MYYTIAIIVLLTIIFLPRIGLLAIYKNYRTAQQREQVEDALKHLLDREQNGRHASPESIAGTLDLPRVQVTRLIADMESQGLLETHGAQLHLTTQGTRWAMHIVRAHRLWERYLVDEARMPLSKIHDEAHKRERAFTEAQLNELDAALGHPRRLARLCSASVAPRRGWNRPPLPEEVSGTSWDPCLRASPERPSRA